MADADVTTEETGAGEAAGARRPVTVVLADDQALMRMGFRMVLDAEEGIEVVGEASDGASALAQARALEPDVILMDEPCSALDPISTLAIEDLINELKTDYTVVIVTHNMQQASRVSDKTAFFNIAGTGKPGKLIEYDDTNTIFTTPSVQATEDYVSGRFG